MKLRDIVDLPAVTVGESTVYVRLRPGPARVQQALVRGVLLDWGPRGDLLGVEIAINDEAQVPPETRSAAIARALRDGVAAIPKDRKVS